MKGIDKVISNLIVDLELEISSDDRIMIFRNNLYKEIPDYPGYYISTSGSVIGPNGNLLKLEDHYTGYYKVHLRDKKCFVHRLVMLTFKPIEGCESLVVNHKDLDKKNNDLNNLEWSTYFQNSEHYNIMSLKSRITEEIKDKIMNLPNGFSRDDLDKIFNNI